MAVSGTNTLWQDGIIDVGTLKIGAVAVTATPAEMNYLDLDTLGTGASSKAVVLDASSDYTYPSGGTFTLAGTNAMTGLTTLTGNNMAVTAGVGITGAAEVFASGVERIGTLIKTTIWINITGLTSIDTDDDIIGDDGTGAAHLGQITAAANGTIFEGSVMCHEVPAGGTTDIAIWEAVEATGVENTLITALTGTTELMQSQGDSTPWLAGDVIRFATFPTAGKYLYLVVDGAGTDGDYTTGIFEIVFWGV